MVVFLLQAEVPLVFELPQLAFWSVPEEVMDGLP